MLATLPLATTSTGPTLWAGAWQLMAVGEMMLRLIQSRPSKVTKDTALRLMPVKATVLPPVEGPSAGMMESMRG